MEMKKTDWKSRIKIRMTMELMELGVLPIEDHVITVLDLETGMEMKKTEREVIGVEVEIENVEAKEEAEKDQVKVVEVEVKIDQIKDEVEAENEVINAAEVKVENVEEEAGVMKEKEVGVVTKVGSEELAAEVLEEVRHLHLDQGLVVDLDDPEVALRLIFP